MNFIERLKRSTEKFTHISGKQKATPLSETVSKPSRRPGAFEVKGRGVFYTPFQSDFPVVFTWLRVLSQPITRWTAGDRERETCNHGWGAQRLNRARPHSTYFFPRLECALSRRVRCIAAHARETRATNWAILGDDPFPLSAFLSFPGSLASVPSVG